MLNLSLHVLRLVGATQGTSSAADVDVLQVDATSETSSVEEQRRGGTQGAAATAAVVVVDGGARRGVGVTCRGEKTRLEGKGVGSATPTGDDLRNYAYEGEGSSPGSLSSCKNASSVLQACYTPRHAHPHQPAPGNHRRLKAMRLSGPITT